MLDSDKHSDRLAVTTAIAELRRRFGLTQEEFAARIGCKLATLQSWEHARYSPSGYWIRRLAALFPDDGIRFAPFESAPSRPAPNRAGHKHRRKRTGPTPRALGAFHLASQALQILVQAAAAGHEGAEDILVAEADRLIDRAARWRDLGNGLPE